MTDEALRNVNLLRENFEAQLESPAAKRVLEEAKPRHAVLKPFDSIGGIARAIEAAATRGKDGQAVDGLLGAVLGEFQQRPSSVWASTVLVAFYPGVVTLLRRLRTPENDPEERRALAIESYLAAARSVDPRADRLPMRIVQFARRYAFHDVDGQFRDLKNFVECVTDAQRRGLIEPFVGSRREVFEPRLDELLDLHALLDPEDSPATELVERMLAANTGDLAQVVVHARPDLPPEEQRRLYNLLRKQLMRLRARSGEPSPRVVWKAVVTTLGKERTAA